MSTTARYHRGAERPALAFWILDDDGDLIDFSSGYTFALKVGRTGEAALLTKATGIAGATGAGVEPTGTPNVVVTWSSGDLDIAPGAYEWQLTATTGGLDRVFSGAFHVTGIIS